MKIKIVYITPIHRNARVFNIRVLAILNHWKFDWLNLWKPSWMVHTHSSAYFEHGMHCGQRSSVLIIISMLIRSKSIKLQEVRLPGIRRNAKKYYHEGAWPLKDSSNAYAYVGRPLFRDSTFAFHCLPTFLHTKSGQSDLLQFYTLCCC